jgi:hypothetical protein
MPLQDFFQQCFVEVGLLKHLFNAGKVLVPPHTGASTSALVGS